MELQPSNFSTSVYYRTLSNILNFVEVKGKGSPFAALSLEQIVKSEAYDWNLKPEHPLYWTQDTQATYVSVFATHLVRNDDYLQHICIHGLAERKEKPKLILDRIDFVQERKILQAILFVTNQFRRNVKRDPSIWLIKCCSPNILQVTGTGASAYCQIGGCV